jgi:hypothetical protein
MTDMPKEPVQRIEELVKEVARGRLQRMNEIATGDEKAVLEFIGHALTEQEMLDIKMKDPWTGIWAIVAYLQECWLEEYGKELGKSGAAQ